MGKQGPVKIEVIDDIHLPEIWYKTFGHTSADLFKMVTEKDAFVPEPLYLKGKKIPYNKKSESYTDNEDWIVNLNRYERDNLLHLLQAVEGKDGSLHRYNSGDWVGMIGYKLTDSNGKRDNLDANYVMHEEEEPPNADEWASMQRWLKFIRGQLLKTPRPLEDQHE